MHRNSNHGNDNPILGCSRAANYTKADFSKDLQVYHFSNSHHSNLHSNISPKFVQDIEVQNNANNIFSNNMKGLYMDQLEQSLKMYQNKMMNTKEKQIEFRKDYKENINGVVQAMEKSQARHFDSQMNRLQRQRDRQDRFVDADLIKNKKIDDFVNQNEFKYVLGRARQQNIQENMSNVQEKLTQNGNHLQKSYSKYETYTTNPHQNTTQTINNQSPSKLMRAHNPITNPIEYHIQNPYFIKKMQQRQNTDPNFVRSSNLSQY